LPIDASLVVLIYLIAQLWAAIAWTGGWRVAALAPLAVLAVVLIPTIVAKAQGSNLWPLLLILFPLAALVWLAGVALARLASRLNWPK
jgi:hypothetical protein